MISSLVTPVRWYNDFNQQDRFVTDCNTCEFELITDKTRLSPFQIRRNASIATFNRWFMRKACQNPYNDLLNTNDSLFILDSTYWSLTQTTIIDGKCKMLRASAGVCELTKLGIFTSGKSYKIKIVITEISGGSFNFVSNNIFLNNSLTTLIPGVYEIDFLANGTDIGFFCSLSGIISSYAIIESINIYEYTAYNVSNGDFDLPIGQLDLFNIGSQDVIMHCGANLPKQLPCGKYYMIIEQSNGEIFYSEVISIKDFVPQESPYVLLEWRNECDISDVIYKTVGDGCIYWNRLYVDGPISKAEYSIKEEGEEDGNQTLNITFQKWEKSQTLLVPKAPEFLTDSLTVIRLHDTIKITNALRKNQIVVSPSIEVTKTEHDIQYIFSDCMANINLKLFLTDKIIDSTCCNNTLRTPCYGCTYTVSDYDVISGNYYFGTPPEAGMGFGFYILNPSTGTLTLHDVPGEIICVESDGKEYYSTGDAIWIPIPTIITITTGASGYYVQGYAYPGLGNFITLSVWVNDGMISYLLPDFGPYPSTSVIYPNSIFVPFTAFAGGIQPSATTVFFKLNALAIGCIHPSSDVVLIAE
jgi:hypothetical protein